VAGLPVRPLPCVRASTPVRICFLPFRRHAVPASHRFVVAPDLQTGHTRCYSAGSVVPVPSSRRTHAPDTHAGHTPTPSRRRRAVPSSRSSVVAPFRAVPSSHRFVVTPDLRAGHTRCYSAGSVVSVPSSRRSVVAPDTRTGHRRRTHAPDTCAGHTPTPSRRRRAVPSSRRFAPFRRRAVPSSCRSVVTPFRRHAVPSSRRTYAPDTRAVIARVLSSRRSVVAPFCRHAGLTRRTHALL